MGSPNLVATAVRAAQRYGLQPAIFLALIDVESGWDDDVIYGRRLSSAGAGGIAQWMTPTWDGVLQQHPELIRDYGARRGSAGRFDPVPALYASAAHIADMLRAAGGDYSQALGGYYAGWGGRQSADGRYYANLVLSKAGQTSVPQVSGNGGETGSPSPLITPEQVEQLRQSVQQHLFGASERTRTQVLDPLARLVAAAEQRGIGRPQELLERISAGQPSTISATNRLAKFEEPSVAKIRGRLAELQTDEAVRTFIDKAKATPVSRAQFGGIVGALQEGARNLGGGIADVARPVVKPVLRGLEAEQNLIGRPLARGLITATPLRFLPDPARGITEDVLSSILVPSTFLMPYAGRAITVGSVLGRFSLRSLAHPDAIRQEYASARLVLRVLFPSEVGVASRIQVANRLAAESPAVIGRRVSSERLQGQLKSTLEDIQSLRPGATRELRAFGRTVGTVNREQLEAKAAKLRERIATLQQGAVASTRHDVERVGLGLSSDPGITEALNKTEAAMRSVPDFNRASRYSPMRLAFWRQHVSGWSDEMDQTFRWLNPDLADNAPAHLRLSVDDLAARRGLNIGGLAPDDPVIVRLAKEAEEQTADNISNWRATLKWIENLGVEGAFDPKANPGTIFNWAIRGSEPLRHIPIVGKPLAGVVGGAGRMFQPLGSLDDPVAAAMITASRYRNAAVQNYMQRKAMLEIAVQNKFGEGLNGKALPLLKSAYRGPSVEQRAREALDRYVAFQGEKKLVFNDEAQKEMLAQATKAFRDDVGTVKSAFEHPDWYDLDEDATRLFRFVSDNLDADRDALQAFGVSVGRINGAYLPNRRVAGQPIRLGTGGRAHFPRAFRSRQIEDFDDFVFAAAIDGQEAEYNISRLLDTRLGQGAEKQSFQVIMKLLDANEATQKYVERPLITRVKGPIDTRSEEFREALVRGLKGEFENADDIAADIIGQLPEKLPILEAEQLLGRELTLKPVSKFTDDAERATVRKLESFFGGTRTVEVDENFVGRTLDAMRSMLLSMDLSPVAFVQGARVFAQDPIGYLRTIGTAAGWQMTQHGRRVSAIQNAPRLRFWAARGLQMGHPMDIKLDIERKAGESVAAWMGRRTASGVLPPWDSLNREMMDALAFAKLHVADTTYSTLLMAQENPEIFGLLKSLPMFKAITTGKEWRAMPAQELANAVADGLNNYIGPVEFAKISGEARPRMLERLALLTPSWTRGNIGMILNAPKAGQKGVVARHLFMNQLALQASLATKLSLAFSGKMPEFDPTSTDFLNVQTPAFRFALFPTMSAFRLPFRILAGRPEGDRRAEEAAWEQPLTEMQRFFQGRLAQGPRIAVDLLRGEDFLGRTIDAPERFVVKEMMPIIAQELWESMDEGNIPPGEVAQRGALEFLGAQVIPKTPFQLYREQIELLTGKDYESVTSVERRQLEQEHETLRDLRERQNEYRARRGDRLDQFFNLTEDTRGKANEQIRAFLDAKQGQPGMLVEYAKLSGASLTAIAQENRAAMIALFGSEEDFKKELGKRPGLALDEIARRYWGLSPDGPDDAGQPGFVDKDGNRWSLDQAFLDVDPDSYRDQLWRAYRETRESVLARGASEFGISEEAVRQYVLHDWPSVRWRDPRASELEVRRVGAQRALDKLFETSPYRHLNGGLFTPEEVRRLRELRVAVQQVLSPMRATYQTYGRELPDGSTRSAISQILARTDSEEDKRLLNWLMMYSNGRMAEQLRNPERDLILIENPDVIKMYPDRVRFLLSTRLLATPLGQDPEVVAAIEHALA